jgi:hypothetical protein
MCLKHLQPTVPVQRYQWARFGDMIDVGIKQLVRFDRTFTGSLAISALSAHLMWATRKSKWTINFATQLGHTEMLQNVKQSTTCCFLKRPVT